MKIFVNARFLTQPVSGVQRYGIECSRQIKKLYPEAEFVAPPHIIHHDIAKELNVKIIGSRGGHLWEQIDLPLYLAKQKFPPLLNLANTGPVFYSNNYVTIHDLAFYHHPEWNSRKFSIWYNILIPRLAYRSRHIFTVSNTIKNELVKCYDLPPSKISVTYNGISQNMLEAAAGNTIPKEKIILSVGTFNIRKNHPNLVAGYLDSKYNKEYCLVLVGDKNKVFKDAGIDEETLEHTNIRIYSTLTEPDLIAMYQRAEVLVSLSLYEGFGIPILEGLFNGCKVICSDIPVYRELFSGSVSFCNPLDLDSITAAINDLTNIPPPTPEQLTTLLARYNYKNAAQTILGKIDKGYK